MKAKPILIAVIVALVSFSGYSQSTTKKERKVKTALQLSVEDHNPSAINLLKKVVNINSGTMNFQGVKEVGQLFVEEYKALGFEAQFVEGSDWNRAGHLIAVHEGKKTGPRILLIGHLDTVFEPESPFQEYTMENDSIIRAPGVVDMKGGDVIILEAMRALKDAGALKDMSIEIIYTGDEEKSGSPLELSKKALIEAAKRCDIAIGFENGDSNPHTAVVSRRGSTSWQLTVTGNSAHSSQVFSEEIGSGAIYEASRILYQFHEQLKDEEFLTFNPGVILGGTAVDHDAAKDGGSAFGKTNVVAQKAIVRGDLRAVSLDQLNRSQAIMQEIVNKSLPGTYATLEFGNSGYPPLSPSEGNRQLLEIFSQVSMDLGQGPVTAVSPINAGAADISFTAGHVKMAIDGLGLSGGNDHTPEEYGNLNWLPRSTLRAALFIYRLSNMNLE